MDKDLQPHELRVIAEREDLAARLERLQTCMATPAFTNLDAAEQFRQVRQHTHMTGYLAALDDRIAAF